MENNEQKQRGRKSATLLLLLILLVTITVGFAVLSTTLAIKGSSSIKGDTTWCVGPECNSQCKDAENPACGIIECPDEENCQIIDCNEHEDHCTCANGMCAPDPIDCDTTPAKCMKPNCTVTATETCVCTDNATQKCIPDPQLWMDGNTVYFEHTLQKPGDVFTFKTKYTNGGTLDAEVESVSSNPGFTSTTAKKFMTYAVAYDNDTAIAAGQALNAGDSVKYKVTVSYRSDVEELPTAAELAEINGTNTIGRNGAYSSFEVNYKQK